MCKECTERCNRPISYENALLSFGSSINLSSRKECQCIGEIKGKNLFLGGGGAGMFGRPPPTG